MATEESTDEAVQQLLQIKALLGLFGAAGFFAVWQSLSGEAAIVPMIMAWASLASVFITMYDWYSNHGGSDEIKRVVGNRGEA